MKRHITILFTDNSEPAEFDLDTNNGDDFNSNDHLVVVDQNDCEYVYTIHTIKMITNEKRGD